jgi:dihydrofolate synthase/folylpolyglutamate synthase
MMRRNPQRFLDTPSQLPPNLSFVLNISPSAMTLGLGNMRALVEAIGHPERAFRSVVVAGTNGKGSVTAYLSAILEANGVRGGVYISPHVYSVGERICIDNVPVSIDMMERAAARIVPLHERIRFSYFEALTAIAFLVFAEAGVEIAVLETGLGGRFDATNIVDASVSVLTSISLDHRRLLGDTEEEILREKLGISRPGVPLLVGALAPELADIVRGKADRENIPLRLSASLGRADLESMSFEGMRAAIRTPAKDYGLVRLPFIGDHQRTNALLSIAAAELLLRDVGNLDAAYESAYLPGRFEVMRAADKTLVLDVAHNDGALAATVDTLIRLSPPAKNAMILGMLTRKELLSFPEKARSCFSRMWLIQPDDEDAAPAPLLLGRFGLANIRDRRLDVQLERRFESEGQWNHFLDRVLAPSNPSEAILVTGSHRTVEAFGRRVVSRVCS